MDDTVYELHQIRGGNQRHELAISENLKHKEIGRVGGDDAVTRSGTRVKSLSVMDAVTH